MTSMRTSNKELAPSSNRNADQPQQLEHIHEYFARREAAEMEELERRLQKPRFVR